MAAKTVKITQVEPVRYEVRDDASKLTKIYTSTVLTRSAKRALLEALYGLSELAGEVVDGVPTEEQESASVRAACDVINLGLTPGKDGKPAGDLLFTNWESDLTPEGRISELLTAVIEALDGNPTKVTEG